MRLIGVVVLRLSKVITRGSFWFQREFEFPFGTTEGIRLLRERRSRERSLRMGVLAKKEWLVFGGRKEREPTQILSLFDATIFGQTM